MSEHLIDKRRLLLFVFSFFSIFTLFLIGSNNTVLAEGVLAKYKDQVHMKTPYSRMPKEVQDLLKNVKGDNYQDRNNYLFGQCTWYAWQRSKDMGREYSETEGDGGEWYKTTTSYGGTNTTSGGDKPIPQVAISADRSYSDLYAPPFNWQFTTHVMYSEYIDSEGYLLLSESNLDGVATGNVYFHIISPDEAQNHGLKYVEPANKDSLSDWGKNPDGTLPKDAVGGTATKDEETKDAKTTSTEQQGADDTFTVNGYGSLTSKDFKEANVTDYLPTQEDIDKMSDSQKQTLMEWIADYSNDSKASILKITRVGIMLIGYALVIFTLLILLAYAFDRVGILEFSCVEMITAGNYTTTYTKEEAQELKHSNLGIKPMDLKSIIMITVLCIGVFVLIVSGKMYYYAYNLYSFIYNISEYMNNIRPK